MKIGFVGLGKLGIPVAVAIDKKGHDILGYDINPNINADTKVEDSLFTEEKDEFLKGNIKENLVNSNLKFCNSLKECIEFGDIIFVAVQTPHKMIYEGKDLLPETREDFDYTHLISCLKDINTEINKIKKEKIVTIISTVLPGTLRKYILPDLSPYIKLCYNPFFIAMGTVMYDFYNPEFILLGRIDLEAEKIIKEFYKTINDAEVYSTSLENAELIKVSYNTFITSKIVLVNNLMELCHHLPNTDVDAVTDALKLSNKRLISKAYLNGGMGDGGGCHPRDNIAMSWLNNKLGIKNNYYDFIMSKREDQTEFLADLIIKENEEKKLDICILGTAFKPETNLKTGSPAVLLINILKNKGFNVESYDPYINDFEIKLEDKIYFIGCKHEIFKTYIFPTNCVVIDPNRYLNLENKVLKYIQVGKSNHI